MNVHPETATPSPLGGEGLGEGAEAQQTFRASHDPHRATPSPPAPLLRRGDERRRLLFVLAIVVLCRAPHSVVGQPLVDRPSPRDAVTLDVDSAAVKKLGAARDLIAAQQWRAAIEMLNQIATQHGSRLTPSGPHRYVPVAMQCQLMFMNLPTDGLRAYREQIDPQVQPWLREGIANHDEELLERVVRQAFASSHADDALFWLGEIAFARGDFSRARRCWESTLPLSVPASTETTDDPRSTIHDPRPLVLTYPDTDLDPAAVRARLVLCSLFERDFGRATHELRDFTRLHPMAEGTLAGRRAVLAEILDEVSKSVSASGGRQPAENLRQDVDSGDIRPPLAETHATFAGSASRQFIAPTIPDIRGAAWAEPVSLPEMVVANFARDPDPFPWRRFDPDQAQALPAIRALSHFPVVFGRVLLACDETSVSAIDLATGRAAWGDDPANAVIYELPDDAGRRLRGRTGGVPAFTLTVSEGKAFARLGSPVTSRSDDIGLDRPASVLVCLDVARGEGKLLWSRDAATFEPPNPLWSFEGSPAAVDGRLFVALRQGSSRPQMFVACLDANTGKTIWLRRVCIAESSLAGHYYQEISHQLVSVADGTVFYNTNAGAIVALDATDGSYRWVATYPRVEPESQADFNLHRKLGPNPCVVESGVVFAAPYDSADLLALDAPSGLVLWSREVRSRTRVIVGVGRGPSTGDRTLVLQTDQVWGLHPTTGRVRWQAGSRQPVFQSYGRAVLAGDTVVCPTREEIWLVDHATGAQKRRLRLSDDETESGGNVLVTPDRLVIAGTNRLAAFGPAAPVTAPGRPRLLSKD